MIRFVVPAVALVVVAAGAAAARGQDADVVKRLTEKVELLETKLKLAEREIQDLKRENEQLKTGGGKGAVEPAVGDRFGVGTKLTGSLVRSWAANGKRVTEGGDAEFEVTKRSGKDFVAEFWTQNRKYGLELEGTVDGGFVKFRSTKSLNDAKLDVVGLHVFTGRLDKGVLTGRTTKKGDPTYIGEWKLTVKKE